MKCSKDESVYRLQGTEKSTKLTVLTVLIDLEGDIYERFTKCNVLEQQICLHR